MRVDARELIEVMAVLDVPLADGAGRSSWSSAFRMQSSRTLAAAGEEMCALCGGSGCAPRGWRRGRLFEWRDRVTGLDASSAVFVESDDGQRFAKSDG